MKKASIFKPTDIVVKLGDNEHRLVYDLNAFAELEKIYESIDSILQMLLGTDVAPDMAHVTYLGAPVNAHDILVADVPLTAYITKISKPKDAKTYRYTESSVGWLFA